MRPGVRVAGLLPLTAGPVQGSTTAYWSAVLLDVLIGQREPPKNSKAEEVQILADRF